MDEPIVLRETASAASVRLTSCQRHDLLTLARETITCFLTTGEIPDYVPGDPALLRPAAVFVTLRLRPDLYGPEWPDNPDIGPLRGCIGQLEAERPLYRAVQEAAVRAATIDPRFPPVRLTEVPELTIEISVLSPLKPVRDIEEIIIGMHGLVVSGRGRRGLLLPDVPLLFNWGACDFVRATCHKAGLPDSAWPGSAKLMSFTTEKISETDALP